MPLLLLLFLLLPMVLAAAQALNKRFVETAPLVALGTLALQYLLGLFSLVVVGVWLLRAAWLASVAFLCWSFVKRRKALLGRLDAGLLLFVVLAALLWWLCRGRQYANWDEYSHWGRALKGMFLQDVLPALASVKDGFKEYPPGAALWQYTVMKGAFLPFREDVAIFTQGLFSLSLLLYPLALVPRQSRGSALVAAGAAFAAPLMVFNYFYTETTVDALLGVAMAFALLVHFLGGAGRYAFLMKCLAMAALPLLKSSGALLGLLAGLVMLADVLWGAPRHGSARPEKPALPQRINRIAMVLAPLLCVALAYFSWEVFLAAMQVPRRWSLSSLSTQSLWQFFTGSGPAYRGQTARFFAASIFADFNYGWPLKFFPYAGWFVLFGLLFAGLRYFVPQEKRRRFTVGFVGLFAAGVVYTVLVLLNYLFVFPEVEAVVLASLSRYLNTYLVAMLLYLAGWLAVVLPGRKLPGRAVAALGTAAVWLLGSSPSPLHFLGTVLNAPIAAAETDNYQRPYKEAAAAIRSVDASGNPQVFVVAQQDFGRTTLRIDYELLPAHLPEHTSSIGSPYQEDDLWTAPYTAESWAAELQQNYEYVYLFEVDAKFALEFGALFPADAGIVNGAMYAVEKGGNGGIALKRLF